MPQIDRRYRDIVAHYEDCLARYGDNRLGVDWPRREDAELRYAVMLDLIHPSDGLQWERKPDPAGLDRSADGWDSVMLTYTSLLRVSGKMLYFYNGGGFGRAGFGYAMAEVSGGSQARVGA